MARIQEQDANTPHAVSPQTGEVVIRATIVAISCVVSYWLITHILANTYSISREVAVLNLRRSGACCQGVATSGSSIKLAWPVVW
jgi:hypothetical protein